MCTTTVLVSSAGRRIALLGCFKEALNKSGRICIIDSSRTAPAKYLAEDLGPVPHCTASDFVQRVAEICARECVTVLIPTIDTELPIYASARDRFEASRTAVCISSAAAVGIAVDKVATHEFLTANCFPTVQQSTAAEVLRTKSSWQLPLIGKPRYGSAAMGVRVLNTWPEVELLATAKHDFVLQETASGREFTTNLYVNLQGECVCAVPHWRIEVRGGEVSKGITVKNRALMLLMKRVAEALPGAYGPLNVQCFVTDGGDIKVIEINARFGGGYPLAHRAGAQFTHWILQELNGHKVSYIEDWQDGLAMLRYDEAVFVPGQLLQLGTHA